MKAVITAAAQAIQDWMQHHHERYRVRMVTVTYRPGATWEPHDVSRLLDHYRDWLANRGAPLRAVWVLELQKRGAPHYHILLWTPRGATPPHPDRQGWWKKGASNCQWAHSPVGYVIKYASKGTDDAGELPRHARLFGVYGCPRRLDWWRAPAWMREIARPGWRIRYRPGGWWCVDRLAHAWRSPWRIVGFTAEAIQICFVGWSALDVRPLVELGF